MNLTEGNTTLEVPYSFGKLNIYEMVDPSTKNSTGIFNITDQERGYSFGILKIANNQDSLSNDEDMIGLEEFNQEAITRINQNTDDQTDQSKQSSFNLFKRSTIDEPFFKTTSNMIKLKQENAYLVEGSNNNLATNQNDSLQLFRERIGNLNLPYVDNQWGSLLFYSGQKLLHTHHLWKEVGESVIVSQESLLNIKVPMKFNGTAQFSTESLVSDFRYSLGDGFILTRSKENITFKRVTPEISKKNAKLLDSNKYKIFTSGDRSVTVASNEIQVIYDNADIKNLLTNDVNSMKSAYEFTKNLDVVIVIQNRFMGINGLNLGSISRQCLSNLPYYIVLKVHSGYESLNEHMRKLINKHLKKNNMFFGQVYNVKPDLNLKSV